MATKAAYKRVSGQDQLIMMMIDHVVLTVYIQLTREYQNIQKNPPPFIVAHPSETNILEYVSSFWTYW